MHRLDSKDMRRCADGSKTPNDTIAGRCGKVWGFSLERNLVPHRNNRCAVRRFRLLLPSVFMDEERRVRRTQA